ncbi:intraflagellar transport protein 20 homolog isoform X2 [Coccinella septempunctata]|uniref:intraflagellar transport protein 20 homolog isoform X2 n=1 Tax=Coccinella septempunctata TaxID=41139 RepID=UPI001D06F720|nr:intraflagellar transport protein 20 homolog isoform X2 [Coccinella septempunctata]
MTTVLHTKRLINSSTINHFKEVTIPVPWGKISGKWWGPTNEKPILCIHGFRNYKKAMAEILARYGIYFDEVDKICILEPEIFKQTNDLKEECKIYTEKIEEFQKIGKKFTTIIEELANKVENEKINAIGARNILQGMEKQKENHQQQLHALIVEKSMELERLKIQLNSLQKTEMEQQDLINQMTQY